MRKSIFGIAAIALCGWSGTALADEGGDWSLHGFGDVSVKNDYITPRGLVVTSKGTTVQVLDGLVFVSPGGIAITAGTWTDLNPGYGDGNITAVNEFDFFVGVSGNVAPRLEAGVQYVQFVSGQPSVAFHDERNIEFSLKYHDGAKDSPVSIKPYAKFFWAVDGDSTVVLGKKGGTFDIELGAEPTYAGEGFKLSAPTWITVGPKTYWGAKDNGLAVEGQNFGVVSTGLKASTPLSFIKGGAGASVYAQAQYYHLINDNLVIAQALLNGGTSSRDKLVVAVGLNFGF
ncbi:hypothetical protein SAMN05518801_10992 [Novosphingobium sp. CF614]|uniref:hypothetical protein n=1 Tax=Novosphingobium sp. CF614 TaxID=1884364 RepID=UPI0008DFFD2E|nr:hypothetical protein [Novosphingobium sp. CF614]SFG18164.1 hypothetical protein SAMN05518801_10992 [Novosphingobium sp. CF614]